MRDISEAVEVITRAGARLGLDRYGRLVTADLPEELRAAVEANADALALAVAGYASGHRWAACTTCGLPALISTGAEQPCRQTPRCKGKLKAYATARPEPGIGLPCARPGCTNEAQLITATHEPLCRPDFVHLAIRMENTHR